ncbi:PP2C family protein-serine/threonine phosphatase [Streptomyces sp. WMMB303]|uniref:PP2C family protein-serine/threonine phosphatase n=1 Tax=Streptomyces sp. WMMB303 TaxID=3034154 RepID=UPI0023EC2C85|nr:PP2C family protein-serine/threonine phosphatase [Streptomyces sp. WMMB303]MDF4252587.1 PP2C family protein-serine/threonine phosphatase [Streptomyces sp. WMMB303]
MNQPRQESGQLTTVGGVRRAVRRLARTHGLPAELRARLVVSVTAVARDALAEGRGVRVSLVREGAGEASESGATLACVLAPVGTACQTGRRELDGLPLPATAGADGAAEWHLPPRASGNGAVPPPDGGAAPECEVVHEELRAVLDRCDAVEAEHRLLKAELAETNSGVLALYVQLEERDEQLRRAHGQMLRELEDALRPAPLSVPGLELAVHYAPADTDAPTGGDLYDWFRLPDGTVHITVVDALGHGVRSTGAALNVTQTVRTLALEGHPPGTIVERASEILASIDAQLLATVLLARVDPDRGEVLLANGSHPPALVVREDGTSSYLQVAGRGVGFPLPGSEDVLRIRLAPGDLLVLYTDGLTESRKDPLEGEARLVDSAARHRWRPIEEIPEAIAEDMHTVVLHPDDTLALALRLPGR